MSKVVIFTDLHYGEDISGKNREWVNTHWNTYHLLEKFKVDVGTIEPEIIINLWDLVFGSTREKKLTEYRFLKDNFLDSFSQQIYHMFWNHEFFIANVDEIQEILWNMWRKSFVSGDIKHIILDIALSENKLFEVSKETISWLKKELVSENKIVIYCHFPITEEENNISYVFWENGHRAFLENSKELRKIIKWTNCKFWISGHTHFEYRTLIDDIQHVTLPSFSEDHNGLPNWKYAILNTETMSLDVKRISFWL